MLVFLNPASLHSAPLRSLTSERDPPERLSEQPPPERPPHPRVDAEPNDVREQARNENLVDAEFSGNIPGEEEHRHTSGSANEAGDAHFSPGASDLPEPNVGEVLREQEWVSRRFIRTLLFCHKGSLRSPL